MTIVSFFLIAVVVNFSSSIASWPARRAATVASSRIGLISVLSILIAAPFNLTDGRQISILNAMVSSQHSNISILPGKVTICQRIVCLCVFSAILSLFVFLWLASRGDVDVERVFGVCGFKQRYSLPCPGCGITRSAMEFVQGHFVKSFYIQPAGGVMCVVLATGGLLCFSRGIFGTRLIPASVSVGTAVKYTLICGVIIIVCGWAVTLARAFAMRQ